jgi:lipopolysaccharide transport system ATP-binding protein
MYLLIDEVLAVGDLSFIIKGLNAMQELMKNCAVIFVTHSMPMMSRVCTRCMLLENGVMELNSERIGEVIELYTSRLGAGNTTIIGDQDAAIENVLLLDQMGEIINKIKHYEHVYLKFICKVPARIKHFNIRVIIRNIEQRSVLEYYSGIQNNWLLNERSEHEVGLDMGIIMLNTGKYSMSLVMLSKEGNHVYYRVDNVVEFMVSSEYTSWSDLNIMGKWELN